MGNQDPKGGERGLRWKYVEVTSIKMASFVQTVCVKQEEQWAKNGRIPKLKGFRERRYQALRRSTHTRGECTHCLICSGISRRRTQKKSPLPDSSKCQLTHLPPNHADIWRSGQQCASAAHESQLRILLRTSMFNDIMLLSRIWPWWKYLHNENWQTGCKLGLQFWRAALSAPHCPGVPLRLCLSQK